MKKTELKDVYCVPKTEGEWESVLKKKLDTQVIPEDMVCCAVGQHEVIQALSDRIAKNWNRKEIPVSKFVDLLEDRIVGWRLEEIGFRDLDGEKLYEDYELRLGFWNIRMLTDLQTVIFLNGEKTNIKTFTELETLIRFLR